MQQLTDADKKLIDLEVDELVALASAPKIYRNVTPMPSPAKIEMGQASFKFDEDKYFRELILHVKETYEGHYSGKYQATDMIIDSGHGIGFCVGSIMKYAKRYGKKEGYNRKDILKILHYGLILLYIHDQENNKS